MLSINRKLFGTDGIRGIANKFPMTPEISLRLGKAIAVFLRSRISAPPKIVIGKDTRLSGYIFEQAIASGITSMGADVLFVGPLPTPAIAFITSNMRADAGIVISASHNQYQDNGIKIFDRFGFKLPDDVESQIENLILNEENLLEGLPSEIGKAKRIDDAVGRYIVFLKNTYPSDLTLEGFKIVIDCAHGAAYKVAPIIFEELGASVTTIGVKPDGKNINVNCGSLNPKLLADKVI
ncbi:MAG: phosphoglucosamine mutase, partial [Thermodesulfobacteriota bacterium]